MSIRFQQVSKRSRAGLLAQEDIGRSEDTQVGGRKTSRSDDGKVGDGRASRSEVGELPRSERCRIRRLEDGRPRVRRIAKTILKNFAGPWRKGQMIKGKRGQP